MSKTILRLSSFSYCKANTGLVSQPLLRRCHSSKSQDLIISHSENGIRTLTLNRPEKLNSLNLELYTAIPKALADETEKSAITVITGKGPFFSSGNDLMNFAPMIMNPTPETLKTLAHASKDLLENYVKSFIDFKGILVGVVNGPAFGISVTTLALYDVVYAVNTAYFKTPFTKLGQSPEGCSSYLFPKLMGDKKANQILLLDGMLTAAEAKEVGLVTEVFSQETFQSEVHQRLTAMSKLPPKTLKSIKNLVRSNEKEKLHEVNKKECELLIDLWQGEECIAAMAQFAARKK